MITETIIESIKITTFLLIGWGVGFMMGIGKNEIGITLLFTLVPKWFIIFIPLSLIILSFALLAFFRKDKIEQIKYAKDEQEGNEQNE